MALVIRKATASDAPQWLELIKWTFGMEYPARQIYDAAWLAGQLAESQGETWVAEKDGKVCASISVLLPYVRNDNPVANLGRYLALPASYQDGSAEALLKKISDLSAQRKQMSVLRVAASDNAQQVLIEQLGFVCAGYQPFKHLYKAREGVLFYLRIGAPEAVTRFPLSQSLTQTNELAAAVLKSLKLSNPPTMRDGIIGYPLSTELVIEENTSAAYETVKLQAQASNPFVEISGQYNRGLGMFRVVCPIELRLLLGRRDGAVVVGVSYYFDELDRCLRLVDAFALDDLSMGSMLSRVVKLAQEQSNTLYLEVDFLMTAPRILKSAEQLGFVPVAYLPGVYKRDSLCVDLVKMVKLNAVYSMDKVALAPHALEIAKIIDHNFENAKVGVAIINLLRGLPIFDGLGDGELSKVARLFVQKLYRAGEKVFNKGDSGGEAYIVMRGQIDILLKEGAKPVASLGNGQIIGEQAFLDGTPRTAMAVAAQPSILLVVQRQAFSAVIQREPHLGMVIMRNIALELSSKLRKANTALAPPTQPA
jgi:hypothetical protein